VSLLRVAPIVEGHGEVHAAGSLIRRIAGELLGFPFVEALRPIRQPRSKLVARPEELRRAVDLAHLKLREGAHGTYPGLILVLLDANSDPPCLLGPRLLEELHRDRSHLEVTVVLANPEFETWFVAAAESLDRYLDLPPGESAPQHPERARCGKGWVEEHFRGRYSETIDQPRMTAAMDLGLCRRRSPSFDKLCRELEKRLLPIQPER
jgi:hypothetical protein